MKIRTKTRAGGLTANHNGNGTMSANKEIVRRYMEAFGAKDLDAILQLTGPDYVNHAAVPGSQDVEGLKALLPKLWKAMPDQRVKCEDLIGEGDRVVCRIRIEGTQTGALDMKVMSLPATGREVSTEQIHVFRVANGKVVEHWAGRDDIGFLRQLGQLPFPKSA